MGGEGPGKTVGKRNPFPGQGGAKQMKRGAVAEEEVRVQSDRAGAFKGAGTGRGCTWEWMLRVLWG